MPLKIVVPVKQVVDYQVKVRVKKDGSGVETQDVKLSMNPFDEIAVEEAVQLKERGIADEIIAVSIGPSSCEQVLLNALAFGADRGILLQTALSFEPLIIAKLLQQIVVKENPDLVLMGKQAIDDDCSQTGQMLAALLNWPQATFVSKLVVEDKKATVTREIDGGLETLMVTIPAVITTDLRLNQPRYPSLPNIMKAKSKPLEKWRVEDFKVDLAPRQQVLKVTAPPKRAKGIKVNSVNELIKLLHETDKVI